MIDTIKNLLQQGRESMDTVHFEKLNELHEVVERRTMSRFKQVLDNAQTIDKTDICPSTTFYIHDTSHWNTDYNSIVFDMHRGVHKTKRTSKQLINMFIRENESNFLLMQAMGRFLKIRSGWPYVFGNTQFVQTSGASKLSTNWIAVHHLKDIYHDHDDEKRLFLLFKEGFRLNIRLDFKQLHNRMTKVRQYYDLQMNLTKYFSEQFNTKLSFSTPDSYLFTRMPESPRLPYSEYDSSRELVKYLMFFVQHSFDPEYIDENQLDDFYEQAVKDKGVL
ncbi:hypothetical protein ACFPIA_00995 [Pediococcus cellicola]